MPKVSSFPLFLSDVSVRILRQIVIVQEPESRPSRFNKIAIQGTPEMAVDQEVRAYRETAHSIITVKL